MLKPKYCEKILDEYGFGNAEIHLNEWNNAPSLEHRGTSFASAQAVAMMIAMHKETKNDILCYYDARIGPSLYGGMFNPLNHKPLCTYYSLPPLVSCICSVTVLNVSVAAFTPLRR